MVEFGGKSNGLFLFVTLRATIFRFFYLISTDVPQADPWRNGSASDSRSEGCVFDSRRVQIPHPHYFFFWIFFPFSSDPGSKICNPLALRVILFKNKFFFVKIKKLFEIYFADYF